jgi:oligoribonuclease NrnB/cAMP/cGMP phosphodiesterase (DHH superfamily)
MINILYHKDCLDGLGAAYAAYLYYRPLVKREQINLFPVQYGEHLPKIENNQYVVIVDFSYSREVLTELAQRSHQVIVLDHHKTAQEQLQDLVLPDHPMQAVNHVIKFDMTKSGAVLAWEHFFPDQATPELLLYIQDRDLWQWKLPNSREISAALQTYPKTIGYFDWLVNQWTYRKNEIITNGELLLKNQQQIVESLAKRAEITKLWGHEYVPIINSCTLQSELGEQMIKDHPQAKFAAVYFHPTMKERVFSLRSRGDFDVSEIARRYGGGGHAAAAGFKVSNND